MPFKMASRCQTDRARLPISHATVEKRASARCTRRGCGPRAGWTNCWPPTPVIRDVTWRSRARTGAPDADLTDRDARRRFPGWPRAWRAARPANRTTRACGQPSAA